MVDFEFISTKHAASFLDLSPRTLEKYRLTGEGPVFDKLGRRVVYRKLDLMDWAEIHLRRSTTDPGFDSKVQI